MSALERLVHATAAMLNPPPRSSRHPARGPDVKVMGIRHGRAVSLTIACAMVSRHLADLDAYAAETAAIARQARALAAAEGFDDCAVAVNAADDRAAGSLFLTVTGTSAEAGDDGQVGRGNRTNGLITPGRPMSLEATAGKNPVSHVGKIYNVVARQIAQALVDELADVAEAHCTLVSCIGRPVTEPAVIDLRLATRDGRPAVSLESPAAGIAHRLLQAIPTLVDRFVAGTVDVF